MKTGELKIISYQEAADFLLPRHYSGRIPSISIAFGWIINNKLMAVCTFGKPASPSLCNGICGKKNSQYVYELNRLCRLEELNYPLSEFVSACLKYLKAKNWIIVSYSDTAMHHCGYIYQACNFIYTGKTRDRTDKYTEEHHSRHYDKNAIEIYRQYRSSKHRYIYFCTHSKILKEDWMTNLKYMIQDYPKEENENYILGHFIEPTIIKVETGEIIKKNAKK